MDHLNIVNNALLEAESDINVGLAMRTFAGFVLHARYIPPSGLVSGNSLTKPSC